MIRLHIIQNPLFLNSDYGLRDTAARNDGSLPASKPIRD